MTNDMSSRPRRVKESAVNGVVPVDPAVKKFNALNSTITSLLPAFAVAVDTVNRVVPLLRQMQRLLSQRPHGGRTGADYKMLQRLAGVVAGPTHATRPEDLPTWSTWLASYAREINYSVRHLQRLVLNEPRQKYTKECGWSRSDHTRLRAAAGLGLELARAIEAGVDTTALVAEIHRTMDSCEQLLTQEHEVQVRLRKRRPRQVTAESLDLAHGRDS
jgi:hypothetical protein